MSERYRDGGYGANRLRLLFHDIKDRLNGRKGRANARWGWVSPPPGRGRVIWLRAGGSVKSVRLAADLLAAIRDKRQDVRLVLTFQQDYPEIYGPRLQGLKKVGVGFGHCDTPGTVRRIFQRLDPFAVIVVGELPGEHFLAHLEQADVHGLAFQLPQSPPAGRFECGYPPYGVRYQHCDEQADGCDMNTLLAQAQVEPSLAAVVRGDQDLQIWWIAGLEQTDLARVVKAWRDHALSLSGVLCVSAAMDGADISHGELIRLSDWDRKPVAAGSLLLLDDERWTAAVAASANGLQLRKVDRLTLWQALAGGAPVVLSAAAPEPGLDGFERFPRLDDFPALFDHWQSELERPLEARRRADKARQIFWQARRQASAVSQQLLQRVFDW